MATYAEAEAGFEAGIACGTHLYNAMPPLDHRSPGLTGALLYNPQVVVGLIADGVHCHPAMIKLAWQSKGSRGLALVTDAMAALGMQPGVYQLGDYEVSVDSGSARLSNGTLAGSIVTLEQALRNLMGVSGCALADAIPSLSGTPAALLGLQNKGVIRPGSDADLTLVTPQGQVVMTIAAGQIVYNTEPERFRMDQARYLNL
jgi:N-acetylglucosamine-6-phosphate deacetylase